MDFFDVSFSLPETEREPFCFQRCFFFEGFSTLFRDGNQQKTRQQIWLVYLPPCWDLKSSLFFSFFGMANRDLSDLQIGDKKILGQEFNYLADFSLRKTK